MKATKQGNSVTKRLLADAKRAVRPDGTVPFGWVTRWANAHGVSKATVYDCLARLRQQKQLPPLTGKRCLQYTKDLNDKHLEMECILTLEPSVTNAELARRLDMTLAEVSFQRGHAMNALRANAEPPFHELLAMKKRQAEIRAEKEASLANQHGRPNADAIPITSDPAWPAQRRRGVNCA